MSKEAMTQALEALQSVLAWGTDCNYIKAESAVASARAAITAIEAALAAPQEPVVPAGWVLVPVEATPEMIAALLERTRFDNSWLPAYRAMLAAAPAAPARAEPTDSMGMPVSCGKSLCSPGEHHPLCKLAAATAVLALRDGSKA